jgi:Amt family ammonium transporter
MLGWLVIEKLKSGHATSLGAASGAVAGMVAITPCAGFVGGFASVYIGFAAGVICYLALGLKKTFKFDDSLDVIAVHLVGGLVGSIVLGLFADPTINSVVANPGLFIDGGGTDLLMDQLVASGVTFAYSFVVSLIIAFGIEKTIGLKATDDQQDVGLDLSLHAETAYSN